VVTHSDLIRFFAMFAPPEEGEGAAAQAGRCRLTVSKPVLKAPMVSALETMIS